MQILPLFRPICKYRVVYIVFMQTNLGTQIDLVNFQSLLQSSEKDLEELWNGKASGKNKSNSTKTITRSESPKSAFERWRKTGSVRKQVQPTVKMLPEKSQDDDMSLLKFLALVSSTVFSLNLI